MTAPPGAAPPASWDPARYLRFADERLRPAADLLARVGLEAPRQVYDLGCGAGNVTALLAARWPGARIAGVDASPDMLARARAAVPRARWLQAEIAGWRPDAPADLVFANASLHWLDDHAALFPRLLGMLAAGGALAVQMPRNYDAPSHRLVGETADAGPWRAALAPARARHGPPGPVAAPEDYHRLLAARAAALDIWETTYLHRLAGADPVLDWLRGTTLRPFLAALRPDERGDFLAALAPKLRRAYPSGPDGRTLFPFRRLFIVARVP